MLGGSVSKGQKANAVVEAIVRTNPGISLYGLAKRTHWPIGKVDGAVRRLVNSGKLFLVADEYNGRKRSMIFPSRLKPQPLITIPSSLVTIGNPTWLDQAHLYALDNHTIGIAGESLAEWRRISKFEGRSPLKREKGRLSFVIPEAFTSFYGLETHYFTKTINSNNILVTVGGPIIESRSYPATR
jgi:hypothetical protein